MTPQLYERLYGLRKRLLAGTVALTLLALALFFSPTGFGDRKPGPADSRVAAASASAKVEEKSSGAAEVSVLVATPGEGAVPTKGFQQTEASSAMVPAREPAPEIAAAIERRTPEEQTYTVRRGDCVWRIAESHCGSGFRWGEVYQANQSQITNPDLIYPDQRFTIPCER